MKIFGINISFNEKKSTGWVFTGGYTTQFANQNGTILDGKNIARNNATYSIMFRINTDIRRCIKEISETSVKSWYEIKLTQWNGKDKSVEVPEFEKVLKASGGFKNIKNEIIKNLSLFGNAYIRTRRNVRTALKYEVMDSRYVAIITDYELNVLRYQYAPPYKKGEVITLMPEEVYHIKETVDMDNPAMGMTIMETLVLDVMGDEEASQSNYHFFGNDSIPSALYILKEWLTADQQKDIFQNIKETLQGGHNKHKNIVSGAITDVKPIRQDHTDMSFKEQRQYTRERVCAAFGVPRTILGYIEDVNHSNGESQYEKFIENTIRPWEQLMEEIFTNLLTSFSKDNAGKNIFFSVNDEHIDDLEKRCTLAGSNVEKGIWTINEAREYIQYDKSPNEFADEITVANTRQLLDNIANQNPPPDMIEPTATEAKPKK